jgi:coproporphyrinogen III oxidase-like Fe-S oxidoreductase
MPFCPSVALYSKYFEVQLLDDKKETEQESTHLYMHTKYMVQHCLYNCSKLKLTFVLPVSLL